MANVEGSIYRVENGVAVPYANLTTGMLDDYDELSNRPRIGYVTLTGNKTLGELGLKPLVASMGSYYYNLFTVDSDFTITGHDFVSTGCLVQFFAKFTVVNAFSPSADGAETALFKFLDNPSEFASYKPYFRDTVLHPQMVLMSEVGITRSGVEIDKGTVIISVSSDGTFNLKFRDSTIGLAVSDVVSVKMLYLDELYGGTS